MHQISSHILFPVQYWSGENQKMFLPELLELLFKLHTLFEPQRQELLKARFENQREYDLGKEPTYLDKNSEAVKGNWKVAPIPPELSCRRVEITGPVHSEKLIINMLTRNKEGSRADMAMLDFEDSLKPSFPNVLCGYKNVISALKGTLSPKINMKDMAYVMVRVRGLHLSETNIQVDGIPISAGLLDLVVCFFDTAREYKAQGKTPKYYIPKCEHYLEARWWNSLFTALEESLNFTVGTMRATFLIETLPAAFQIEEILFEVKDHAVGLNVGRWDKIFSDIKVLRNHPDKIMADRSSINMNRPWMENYAKRVIKICHSRGAFAIGGMSAFTPGKSEEMKKEQMKKVLADKKREAEWGHDGCWVSHPYFIAIAMEAFEQKNQLDKTLPEFDKYADILPKGEGPYTLNGLKTNIRVGIAYMHGWNRDLGCVAFNNLMEDLATLEISRAQTWQWLHHGIQLDSGESVTKDLVKSIFHEECEKIVQDFGEVTRVDLIRAKDEACRIFLKKDLPDFLSLSSEQV